MNSWSEEMALVQSRAILESCNVTDLTFTSGHRIEVRLALSSLQKKQGLSNISELDMGMLFCYEEPTYVPFTMSETCIDLDIAHYDVNGLFIQQTSAPAFSQVPVVCSRSFSYVLEMPAGSLPSGNFRML